MGIANPKSTEREKNLIGSHGIDNDVVEKEKISFCFFFFLLLFHNVFCHVHEIFLNLQQ